MAITKANIREVLKRYMIQNNLGFIELQASLSMNKSKVIMSITEDEDEEIDDSYLYN